MKLTAKDLRVGNWVQNKFGTPYQVTASIILEFSNFGVKDEPIPLTEEWLLRFGFEFIGYGGNKSYSHKFKSEENYGGGFQISMIKGWRYHANLGHMVYIEYVHQLQNLFHSLTGEELTLNQNP
jgi:hypothetical protein